MHERGRGAHTPLAGQLQAQTLASQRGGQGSSPLPRDSLKKTPAKDHTLL